MCCTRSVCRSYWLKAYRDSQMADLMRANLEALTNGESVTDCDIYKYNRNQAETKVMGTVRSDAGGGFYIEYNGKRITLGLDAKAGQTAQICICMDSKDNCCAKSWLDNPVKYL